MKQLLVAVAMVCLATTGCVNSRFMSRKSCGPACHVARSQSAPRPDIIRTAFRSCGCDDVCCGDSCDASCGCSDSCCNASCGCSDGCCDASCGCSDGCCDASCGCSDSCCGEGCGSGCSSCGGAGCGLCQRMVGRVANGFCPHAAGYPEMYNFTPSPPVGQTAYPYYTVRGPRDFLQSNPPSIGPY